MYYTYSYDRTISKNYSFNGVSTKEKRLPGTFFYVRYNHLGNVQVVVSDKRVSICDEYLGVERFEAEVLSAMDYYPFGMMMPDRQWYANSDSGNYRFAFNGKEIDREHGGAGNVYDYGFRIYNPALGKFLSVDPLFQSYAWYTPYQFAGNKPIWCFDIDGLEEGFATMHMVQNWERQDRDYDAGKITYDELVAARTRSQMAVALGGTAGLIGAFGVRASYGYYCFALREPFIAYGAATFIAGVADPSPVPSFDAPGPGDELGRATKLAAKQIFNSAGILVAKYTAGTVLEIAAKNAKLWGGNLINLAANKTTTVIGRYAKGIEFVKASGQFTQGKNTGGINILNISDDVYKKTIAEGGDALFFKTFNKPWLDDAIKRGDDLRLISDPSDVTKLYDEAGDITMFGREVEYLKSKGFTFKDGYAVPSSSTTPTPEVTQ